MRTFIVTVVLFLVTSLCANSVSAQFYYVEADGIGPVRVGVNIANIPDAVNGLFNERSVLEEYDECEDEYLYTYYFKLNGDDTIIAHASGSGEIYSVLSSSKNLRTKSGAYCAMPAREFIVLSGVKVNVRTEADFNQISFEIDGIHVDIDMYNYSDSGVAKYTKAVQSGVTPQFTPQDFNDDAFIHLGGYQF